MILTLSEKIYDVLFQALKTLLLLPKYFNDIWSLKGPGVWESLKKRNRYRQGITDTSGWTILCRGGCSAHYRIFSNFPGFQSLCLNRLLPSSDTKKTLSNIPWGSTTAPGYELLVQPDPARLVGTNCL